MGWRKCCGGTRNVAAGNFFAGLWACSRGRVRESEKEAKLKGGSRYYPRGTFASDPRRR